MHAVGGRGGVLFAAAEDTAAEQAAGMRIMAANLSIAGAGTHRRTTRYTLETIEGNTLEDVQALGTTQSSGEDSRADAVLTLETATTVTDGYRVQLFETYLDSRRDVSGCGSFADGNCSTAADTAEKIGVGDFASLGRCSRSVNGDTEHRCANAPIPGTWTPLQVDRFTAMAIGPTIADGRRTLLLVNSDDNSTQERGTHFVLLALTEKHRPYLHPLQAADDGLLAVVVAALFCTVVCVTMKLRWEHAKNQEWQRRNKGSREHIIINAAAGSQGTKFTNPEAEYSDSE